MPGAQILRRHHNNTIVAPAEQQALRDAPNDDGFGQLKVSKPQLTGWQGNVSKGVDENGRAFVQGVDEDGHAYQHVINFDKFQGVYMTHSELTTGFMDILGEHKGVCNPNRIYVSIRVVGKRGNPVVMGTCMNPPVDGVLHENSDQNSAGCGFTIHLMKDASSNKPLAYLTIDEGTCTSYGGADLTSIAGVGFWLLQ